MGLAALVNVAYGVCVGSWDKFNRYVLPHTADRPVMALSGQTCIGAAYNLILAAYEMACDLDMLILQHDDLEIVDPDAESKFAAALAEPGVLLAGVAGGSARGGLAWWNHDPVGHQRTDAMNIDFGSRTGDVDLLEGSLLVFSRVAIELLRFDLSFTGFHGYDDIGMQASRGEGRAVVVDVDTHHHNPMGFKSGQSHAEWLEADQLFRHKWQGELS